MFPIDHRVSSLSCKFLQYFSSFSCFSSIDKNIQETRNNHRRWLRLAKSEKYPKEPEVLIIPMQWNLYRIWHKSKRFWTIHQPKLLGSQKCQICVITKRIDISTGYSKPTNNIQMVYKVADRYKWSHRTPINGQKINWFSWGYFTYHPE